MTTHPHPRSFDDASADAAAIAPSTSDRTPCTTRHDGWTRARQAAFLRELSATHNVAAAARAVGMSRQSAYQLRTRMQGKPFARAWDAAFLTRFDALAENALDRALHGVEVPHYYKGELVGTSRRFDERLTLALLEMRSNVVARVPHHLDPESAFDPDEFSALIERVERGPEGWLHNSNEELDARFGGDVEHGEGAASEA